MSPEGQCPSCPCKNRKEEGLYPAAPGDGRRGAEDQEGSQLVLALGDPPIGAVLDEGPSTPVHPQAAGEGSEQGWGWGERCPGSASAGQLVKGWQRPWRVFRGRLSASSFPHNSTRTPGGPLSLQSLCSGL